MNVCVVLAALLGLWSWNGLPTVEGELSLLQCLAVSVLVAGMNKLKARQYKIRKQMEVDDDSCIHGTPMLASCA